MRPLDSLLYTYKRYKTTQTHKILALPIVILMPHSACNCRCIMCDIWKDNKQLNQLNEKDVKTLLVSLKNLGTKRIVMSGGEATLHQKFFSFCEILQKESIKITLLTAGLTLARHAEQITQFVDDIIISLDGDEYLHDAIRNIPGAFQKINDGVLRVRSINPRFKITGRTVIHKLNYLSWPDIIEAAKKLGLNQISFLPADVSSHAFNREVLWNSAKQNEILLSKEDLPELNRTINGIIEKYNREFENHFIAESKNKLKKIHDYYAAFHGINPFPTKKCNAPWVSAVIEADGAVHPCFFHESIGNVHDSSLKQILNSQKAINFRKTLDINANKICEKCVCHLNLPLLNKVLG
jgi:MoaA/NifB/PqqE/SkfB family radical SAM enzyme